MVNVGEGYSSVDCISFSTFLSVWKTSKNESGDKNIWNYAICSNMGEPRDYHKSEVSQREKEKYHMISLICGIPPFWRKAMTNLDSVLKNRDSTLLTKICIVKAMAFPTQCCRIDVFKSWCWRKLFKVLWTARRSNQSILKEINRAYSLEGLMLKLKKLQYFFCYLIGRANSFEEDSDSGKDWRQEKKRMTEDEMSR